MPLGDFEREVLRLLAANRHPDSFVGGGTVLHQWKDPGMTPEAILQWARRNAIYRADELLDLQLSAPVTLPELKSRWMEASQSALELIAQLPPAEVGCLYLNAAGQPVCPKPSAADFPKLTRHFGSVKGAWPRIADS